MSCGRFSLNVGVMNPLSTDHGSASRKIALGNSSPENCAAEEGCQNKWSDPYGTYLLLLAEAGHVGQHGLADLGVCAQVLDELRIGRRLPPRC
jgi:hypothetical protein